MKIIIECGGLPHIVFMLHSNHVVMLNEAIVALSIMSSTFLQGYTEEELQTHLSSTSEDTNQDSKVVDDEHKLVLNDPKAFSIVSKTVGLFTNSTFVVINPISFQANTKVTCLVNGKPLTRSILINSGKFYCFFIFQSQPLIFSTIL